MTKHLDDPFDFCRACDGYGGHYESTERGTRIFEPCYLCRGTGNKSLRVDEPPRPMDRFDL